MSHGIVTDQIFLVGDDPGFYKVKIPGVEEEVDMWCVSADQLAIGSKVAIADLDNYHDWSKNNILPNTGVYTYSDERMWLPPEAMEQAKASLAKAWIFFDNWQASCPLYRRDRITSIVDDKYVTLERYRRVAGNVPVDYMECDAEAFEVDDIVVVGFEEGNWNKPIVVGFHEYPKECLTKFYIRPKIDGRSIYYGGQQLYVRYHNEAEPAEWQETQKRSINSDSEWDGSKDDRWGLAGPFELDLWDKTDVQIALDRTRDYGVIRGDIPWQAFLGYYEESVDPDLPCCWDQKHSDQPLTFGCAGSILSVTGAWLGCIGAQSAFCTFTCLPFNAWMANEGDTTYWYGLNQMFDLWIKDNVNGTHRSYYYSNRLFYDDYDECTVYWDFWNEKCTVRATCPNSADPGSDYDNTPMRAYKNLREWGRFDGSHGSKVTPSPDYYRQAEWLAVTLSASVIESATQETVYNPDTGLYEEALVIEPDLQYNLKQTYSDYYDYHPCREDLLNPLATSCFYSELWWAFIDTAAWKRHRRRNYLHQPWEIGDVGVLSLVWADYPMDHVIAQCWSSAYPINGCYARSLMMGGTGWINENCLGCTSYYLADQTGGDGDFNSMVIIASEVDPVAAGPNVSHQVRRPYFHQLAGAQGTCGLAGELIHNIKIETVPVHDYWI